jgi:hypothetical protein
MLKKNTLIAGMELLKQILYELSNIQLFGDIYLKITIRGRQCVENT